MYLDDVKQSLQRKGGHLTWYGGDAQERQVLVAGTSDEARRAFFAFMDRWQAFDCISLHPMITAAAGGRPFRFVRDCEQGLPPYPVTAFELKYGSGRFVLVLERSPVTQPVYCWAYHMKQEALKRPGVKSGTKVEDKVIEASGWREIVGAKYAVGLSILFGDAGRYEFLDSVVAYFTDGAGGVLTSPILREHWSKEDEHRLASSIADVAARGLTAVGTVLNLLACRNVEIEEKQVSAALQKARARRNREPLITYRTLKVSLPKKTFQAAADRALAADELERRLKAEHSVAGHIADYTERGLFGKYKGRFWIPDHTRGSREAGKVIKTGYLLRPEDPVQIRGEAADVLTTQDAQVAQEMRS